MARSQLAGTPSPHAGEGLQIGAGRTASGWLTRTPGPGPTGLGDVRPHPAQRLHHLGRDRVGGRAVQPGDRDPLTGLELDRPVLPVRVRPGVGKKPCPLLIPRRPWATRRRRTVGGSKSSPHSRAARSRRSSTTSSPSWSAPANGGGVRLAPVIMPRSMSFIPATPSSRTRQVSINARSGKRSAGTRGRGQARRS